MSMDGHRFCEQTKFFVNDGVVQKKTNDVLTIDERFGSFREMRKRSFLKKEPLAKALFLGNLH